MKGKQRRKDILRDHQETGWGEKNKRKNRTSKEGPKWGGKIGAKNTVWKNRGKEGKTFIKWGKGRRNRKKNLVGGKGKKVSEEKRGQADNHPR